jgi:hypothetical protein
MRDSDEKYIANLGFPFCLPGSNNILPIAFVCCGYCHLFICVSPHSNLHQSRCISAAAAILSVEYPRGENQNPPEISRIEYGSFNAVGEKLVPFEIRALKDCKAVAAAKVLELEKITEENPVLFKGYLGWVTTVRWTASIVPA